MQNCDCKVTTILQLLQYVFYRMLTVILSDDEKFYGCKGNDFL